MLLRMHGKMQVALSMLIMGSAILLFSCGDGAYSATSANDEARMTEYSENLSVIMSRNGLRSYCFETPLLEGYMQAREPYREFRRGVKITTYQDDSLASVDAVLTSNYAIYYANRELWEARGDVVVRKSDGKELYTQQLYWNARTKTIYSNVDSKIVQRGGTDVFIGEGFQSDEAFKNWRFRRMKGRMEVDVTPTERTDSTASPQAPAATPTPPKKEEQSPVHNHVAPGARQAAGLKAPAQQRPKSLETPPVAPALSAPRPNTPSSTSRKAENIRQGNMRMESAVMESAAPAQSMKAMESQVSQVQVQTELLKKK